MFSFTFADVEAACYNNAEAATGCALENLWKLIGKYTCQSFFFDVL